MVTPKKGYRNELVAIDVELKEWISKSGVMGPLGILDAPKTQDTNSAFPEL